MSDGRDIVNNPRPEKIVALSGENGLYVTGEIQSRPVKFLVDTGASISLVSTEMYNKMNLKNKLQEIQYDVRQADGKRMPVVGISNFEITMGPLRVDHEMIVADLQVDAIIGIDFLLQNECKLDLKGQTMNMMGTIVNLWSESVEPKCCRISVKKDVIIPANHEKLIEGICHRRGTESRLNVIEGTQKFAEKYGLMIGRSLADIGKGQVLLRVLNLSDNDSTTTLRNNCCIRTPSL